MNLVKLYGSIELAPLVELSHAVVDLVSTGNTLKANGLVEVELIKNISSRLIINKASLKLKEKDFYGNSLLMADSAIVYKKEAFYGDVLNIQVSVSECYSYGFELFYLIKNKKNDLEIARVKTGMVCYDHVNKKIKKLPIKFSTHFNN